MDAQERQEWLARRRQGIGSSDIAAICGLSPWSDALSVYLDKLGMLPDRPTEAKRWGLMLEEAVAVAYEEETGLQVHPPPAYVAQGQHPWMLASLDRVAIASGLIPGPFERILELKTSRFGEGFGTPGTDQVPQQYLIQVQWQMGVTGMTQADLAVLIGGQELRIYSIPRSQAIIQHLTDLGGAFWDRVQRQEPPEPDWSREETADLVARLKPPQAGVVCYLGEEDCHRLSVYLDYQRRIKEDSKTAATLRGQLIAAMGEAEEGRTPSGHVLKRRTCRRKGYTVPETSYVDFRIVAPKENSYGD